MGRRVTKGLKQLFQEQRVPASQRETWFCWNTAGQGLSSVKAWALRNRSGLRRGRKQLVAVTVSNPLQEGKA